MPGTPEGPCPSADFLWTAAQGELPGPQLESLALHLRTCALCGEALAISAELAGEVDAPEHRPVALRSRWTLGAVTLAAVAVGFTLMHLQRGTPPEAGELKGPVAVQGSIRALSAE